MKRPKIFVSKKDIFIAGRRKFLWVGKGITKDRRYCTGPLYPCGCATNASTLSFGSKRLYFFMAFAVRPAKHNR